MHINKNFRKLVLFLSITFFGSLSLFGQISHSLSLTGKTLETQAITGENGNVYSKITLGDLTKNRQVAAPELPVKYIKLIIPKDQKPVSFNVSPGASQLVNLSSPIYPVQSDDNPWDKEPKPSFVSTDKELEASTSPYPQTMVRLVNDGFIDGSNHIITLEIMPFQYYASANKLLYYNSLNITVNTVSHTYNVITPNKRTKINQTKIDNEIAELVDNPTDISFYQSKAKSLNTTTSVSKVANVVPTLFFEYVIITTNTCKPYFNDFVNWKRKKGYDIGIVTVDEIYSNYPDGDLISGIDDEAGSIREYLKDSYEYGGTIFALLAGDYNTVPIRYGNTSNNEIGVEADVPTDLYFADFNGDWKVDNDGLYGEREDDQPDYYNEIYVSRLLCNDAESSNILNWVKKVMIYEQNPGNGDYAYLMNNMLAQADAGQTFNYNDQIISKYPSYFINTLKEEINSEDDPEPSSPYGSEIISLINQDHFGSLAFSMHGAPRVLTTLTYGDNMGTKSGLYSLNVYKEESGDGSLDELTNISYPSLLYSVGCVIMPFDDYHSGNSYNMGESFTILGEYGGPSMIGNTRLGSGYSIELFKNFLRSEFPNQSLNLNIVTTTDYSLYSSEIGYHFWNGKSNYVGQTDYHYVILSTNLLGCPQTEYWRSTPQQFSGISITDNGTSITVNTNNNSKCLISVTSVNPTASYQEIVFDETAHTFTTSIRPLQITVTKHYYQSQTDKADYIPYQAITGGTLTSNTKFYNQVNVLNNLTIGSGVTLTVQPGANLNFVNGSSLLVNGTLTSNGTSTNKVTFDFISPNSTTQNGIRVYTGATLNVSNTIVKRAWYGIYCNYTYASPISNWEITECNTGIYFSNTPIGISSNYIHNNSMGIALYNSSPTLTLNKITANTNYGVSSSGSTSIPKFGNGSIQGKNKITGNPVGVCAFSNSLPMLGNNSPVNGGYNTFGENANYNVYALTSGVIYARNNYWGSIPPVSSKIWISSGVILYSPYLYSDPTGLSKVVPSTEDAVLALLSKAMNLIEQKNLLAARDICLDIVNNYSDSYAAFNALSLLTQTFDLSEKETTKLNYKMVFNKDKQKLNAVAGLILAELDKENKLKNIDEVISKFKDDTILEDALFAKFLYYYNDIQDKENARLVSNELDKLFPNSVSCLDAHHHLGDKDYLQKSYSFLKTDQEHKQNVVTSSIPEEYNLFANYPNPFNPATVIKYALPYASNVNITVYNTLGQIVKEYFEGTKEAGYYAINFDGENLSSGVYLYSINAVSANGKQNFNTTKKMLLLK